MKNIFKIKKVFQTKIHFFKNTTSKFKNIKNSRSYYARSPSMRDLPDLPLNGNPYFEATLLLGLMGWVGYKSYESFQYNNRNFLIYKNFLHSKIKIYKILLHKMPFFFVSLICLIH